MIKKITIFMLILFSIFTKAAMSNILKDLGEKTDVSRLEYSLDKLMPKLVDKMQGQTKNLEEVGQDKIDEVCKYTAVIKKNRLGIKCSFISYKEFYFSKYPVTKFEKEVSELSDRIAERLLRVFGNSGDPLKLNIFDKQNIVHLETGRHFTKELNWWDESLDNERLRIGKALSEIIDLFVRIDLGLFQQTYLYKINLPYERMENGALKFPSRILWGKVVDGELIISFGETIKEME